MAKHCAALSLTRRIVAGAVVAGMIAMPALARDSDGLAAAFYDGRTLRQTTIDANGAQTPFPGGDRQTPLGSLWKLFVYAYVVDNGLSASPYVCRGSDPDEVFCCQPGARVGLDAALGKSCGLYFEPARLGIQAEAWREYWVGRKMLRTPWLVSLDQLRPERRVPVPELLRALHALGQSPLVLSRLRTALTGVLIDGTAAGEVRHLGGIVRAKTYTWGTGPAGKHVGGFAGWLNDGSVVWVSGQGSSTEVLRRWHHVLEPLLARPNADPSRECVTVRFFQRYPVRQVLSAATNQPVTDAALSGGYRVFFANGNTLGFRTSGGLRVAQEAGQARVTGTFSLNEYVARVIDREARADGHEEAVKAFAITARTYLIQNARQSHGCYAIADSTRYQRVAIDDPTALARQVSAWTDSLVLSGAMVHYSLDDSSGGRLSWAEAQKLAANGYHFDEILKSAFPSARIAASEDRTRRVCAREPQLETWLSGQSRIWARRLLRVPGYEAPSNVAVCRLDAGTPYADTATNRIYVGRDTATEDRITLAHEYLHLAFKSHPSGVDNRFVESMARELIASDGGEYERN